MKLQRLLGAICAAMLSIAPARATEQLTTVMPIAGPMSMATFAGKLNDAHRAMMSCSWGSSAPANGPSGAPIVYQCWADTTANPVLFKMYDGTSWVTYGSLNTSTHVWTPYRNGAAIVAVATSGSAADLTTGTLPAARLPNPAASALGGIQSKTCSASQWLNDISTSGVPSCAQPNFTDLAGTASLAQLPAFSGMSSAAAAADADTFPTNQGAGNLKQTLAAIKTWIKAWIAKADVGLGNVDNTSDATKNAASVTLTNKTFVCANQASCVVRLGSDVTGTLPTASVPTFAGGDVTSAGGSLVLTIAANAVSNSKMATMAAGTVKANVTGGSAAPTDASVTSVFDVLGSTRGTMLYRGASAWVPLGPCSSGQVPSFGGSGADMSCATVSGGSSSFTQTGGSAVARTIQSKLEDQVNVYDFDVAACDGVTDSSVAINAALTNVAAKGRGTVRVSIYNADCLATHSINLPSEVALEFSGRNATYGINYTPATGSAITTAAGTNRMSRVSGALIKQPNSAAPVINFLDCHTCVANDNWIIGGSAVGSIGIEFVSTTTTATITAISKASSAVVTATNTFSNGDSVYIQSVAGMTQINGQYCTVASASGSGFTCSNINSSGYSTYTSGGTASRLTGDSGLGRAYNNYIGLVYYGIVTDGNANSGAIYLNRIQTVANGTAIYTYSSVGFAGFPNQATHWGNTLESPNSSVVGEYIGPTTSGINLISNRFEGAAMQAITVASGAAKVGLMNNFYSVATKISDTGNVSSGDDEAINGWIAYTPTVVSCVGGSVPTSTFNFKYKRLNRNTTIVGGTQTISAVNTCATGMTISLPNTTNSPGAGSRIDSNAGTSTVALVNTSSTSFFVFGTPSATTYNYQLTYENQ